MSKKKISVQELQLRIGGRFLRDSDLVRMGIDRPDVSEGDRNMAIAKLYDYCVRKGKSAPVIAEHGADKRALARIFETLEQNGAAFWIKGSYVPAAALINPVTLAFCLEAQDSGRFSMFVINQLMGYFDGLTSNLVLPGDADSLTRKKGGGSQ